MLQTTNNQLSIDGEDNYGHVDTDAHEYEPEVMMSTVIHHAEAIGLNEPWLRNVMLALSGQMSREPRSVARFERLADLYLMEMVSDHGCESAAELDAIEYDADERAWKLLSDDERAEYLRYAFCKRLRNRANPR